MFVCVFFNPFFFLFTILCKLLCENPRISKVSEILKPEFLVAISMIWLFALDLYLHDLMPCVAAIWMVDFRYPHVFNKVDNECVYIKQMLHFFILIIYSYFKKKSLAPSVFMTLSLWAERACVCEEVFHAEPKNLTQQCAVLLSQRWIDVWLISGPWCHVLLCV